MNITSVEFIQKKAYNVSIIIISGTVLCRYDNDEVNNSHVIEVIPNEIFHNDISYHNAEDAIVSDFIGLSHLKILFLFLGTMNIKLKRLTS